MKEKTSEMQRRNWKEDRKEDFLIWRGTILFLALGEALVGGPPRWVGELVCEGEVYMEELEVSVPVEVTARIRCQW
jgi:hypothetical protein